MLKKLKKHLILLICTIFTNVVYAYDFAALSPSGHTIYYNIIEHHKQPYTIEITSCSKNKSCYQGDIILPDTVRYNGKLYFVTSIGPQAFAQSEQLLSIELPQTLVSIGNSAFRECIRLKSITFPESLIYIGGYALVNCVSIISLGIPKNVKYIGTFAFGNCRGVSNIYVDFENQYYSSMAGILFSKDGKELIFYPPLREGENFDVPITVNFISDWAFCGAKYLQTIYMPYTIYKIGRAAFWGCKQLVYVKIPYTVDIIKARTFYDCKSLQYAEVSKSTKITSNAFPQHTKIKRTQKKIEDLKTPIKSKTNEEMERPVDLPEYIYAQYEIKQEIETIDTLENIKQTIESEQIAQTNTDNQTEAEPKAINTTTINVEELIERGVKNDEDVSIRIAQSPTGDDNDDVLSQEEIELEWPFIDEEFDAYVRQEEAGKIEKDNILTDKQIKEREKNIEKNKQKDKKKKKNQQINKTRYKDTKKLQ